MLQIDLHALSLLGDEDLMDLGVKAKGDRIKLKALIPLPSKSSEKEQRLKELKNIISNAKRRRPAESETADTGINKLKRPECKNPTSRKQKEPQKELTYNFGWKHWSEEKEAYVQKRISAGGGTRKVLIQRDASLWEVKRQAIQLFFPDTSASSSEREELLFKIGNFRGEPLENGDSFTPEGYKKETGMTQPRLYLLSKKIEFREDDDLESAFSSGESEDTDDTESVRSGLTEIKTSITIMGTSSERQSLKNEQDQAYKESLLADMAKTKKEKERRDKDELKTSDEVLIEDRAVHESLKATRASRVSPEPGEEESDRVKIRIRHPIIGTKTRWFRSNETMLSVYDWCGSLSLDPLYYSLGKTPGSCAKPTESVKEYDQVVLNVCQETNPVCIEDETSNPTVTFKGFGPVPHSATNNDDTLHEIPPVPDELPDVIMIGDDGGDDGASTTSRESR